MNRCSNSAADGSGIGEQATRLIALPSACGVAGAGARGHRGHDLGAGGVGKVDDSFPALAAEHLARKPLGGVEGASSLSAKYVVLAQVPLTRT